MQETGFGDWLADLVARNAGADVAIINSGVLGLGEDLDAGTPLTLEHVIDIVRFDDVIAVETFPARLCAPPSRMASPYRGSAHGRTSAGSMSK